MNIFNSNTHVTVTQEYDCKLFIVYAPRNDYFLFIYKAGDMTCNFEKSIQTCNWYPSDGWERRKGSNDEPKLDVTTKSGMYLIPQQSVYAFSVHDVLHLFIGHYFSLAQELHKYT